MSRAIGPMGVLFLLCGRAFCQSTTTQPAPTEPAFEAADVHVSAAGTTESGGFLPNGRLEFQGTTLLRLIALAYSVPADRVAGGPSWLDTDRFNVTAKAARSSASEPALRTMLQGLLAERFDLSIQRQDKPVPVLALVLAKRGGQKESAGAGEPNCKSAFEENIRTLACDHMTMHGLAEMLPQAARAYFNFPVVDRTGLKGSYDFKLQFMPRGQLPPGSEGAAFHLFNALEKQLGVKVENQTEPMPVLTIERVNRTPAANPPGVTEKLGVTPTEFEVATLRPSRPGENSDATVNAGRIDARALSLKELIAFAYDVEEDWIRGGEKWLETDRYDLMAKSVPTASVDTIRGMVQSLLAERFKLKIHKEPQPVTVYALTAGKSKLKNADASARSTCKASAADGARNYECQNTTMAQFAEKLRAVQGATPYLDHPVVDLTGLKGAYDFSLNWTPRGLLMAGGGGRGGDGPPAAGGAPAGAAAPVAADRPVGLTLFEAVDRQMGLKLAAQKHPMPVVVIDHINRMPTEN